MAHRFVLHRAIFARLLEVQRTQIFVARQTGAGCHVRLPIPIAAFRAKGRLGQLSAIKRHNQQLFDLLVGAQQNRWRHGKAKRLGGLEVDDHLEFCRQLNGQIRRLRAAQNAIDIGGGATPVVYEVGSVGEQTPPI